MAVTRLRLICRKMFDIQKGWRWDGSETFDMNSKGFNGYFFGFGHFSPYKRSEFWQDIIYKN